MASDVDTSPRRVRRAALVALVALALPACAPPALRRFPLAPPMWTDTDLRPVHVPCRPHPEKPGVQQCTPSPYESSFAWDGADNIVFRPVAQFLKVDPGGEAVNVNSLDEVPDSSWFVNRIGRRPMSVDEVAQGYCAAGGILRPETDASGSWLIDQGKPNGANPGFRVKVEGIGRFMLKADPSDQPERATGATAIASRLYYAAGWWAPCDSVVYVHPRLLKLKPGLTVTDNSGVTKPFDQEALDGLLARASTRGELTRFGASKWLPGRPLGPFTYAGTRDDDPNDVIPHEDRRDLRGARLMAAWLNHFDSREQNSMRTWMAVNEKEPESSPGHVRHWYLDLGDCFGSEWSWDGISRRLGHAYYLDIPYVVADFFTLGIIVRPWDVARRSPEGEIFGYFRSEDFVPERWRGGYPNPTFDRMTELDGAWATRIIARFTPEHVEAAVRVGDYTNPGHTTFLVHHLLERQRRILVRYFSKLSPISDLEVRDGRELCGVDLARKTVTYPLASFRYGATVHRGTDLAIGERPEVRVGDAGTLCVPLAHFAPDGVADDDARRYTVVDVTNGSAPGPLRAHLYDLGPKRGFVLAGVERPKTTRPPQ